MPEPLMPLTSQILQLVFFENWLRFYFMEENSAADAPIIRIPQPELAEIGECGSACAALASALNGQHVSLERSREAILNQLRKCADTEALAALFARSDVISELNTFQGWLQLHAAQLEQRFLTFPIWLELYAHWKELRRTDA